MIGAFVNENERETAEEFFELWKTPWEYARPECRYAALLVTTEASPQKLPSADLTIVFCSNRHQLDDRIGTQFLDAPEEKVIQGPTSRFPVFGALRCFSLGDSQTCELSAGRSCAAFVTETAEGKVLRIGYDLFEEVRYLLEEGQPETLALVPTLDLHIDFLRRQLEKNEIEFPEIPPKPAGSEFICCLTHDIDFAGLRRHRFDHTMAGFLVRATLGSLSRYRRGRITWQEAVQNWKSAFKVPLILAGRVPDPWQPFRDYLAAESGIPSTFFILPFQGGSERVPANEKASFRRASPYAAAELKSDLAQCTTNGCEVALHGMDAWSDSDLGKLEKEEIEKVTGRRIPGARMHWLYFERSTPKALEEAGFEWDSTLGYNGAVGYRSGTSQVFRLPGTRNLLELPLHIQDTALFYRDRMDLGPAEAADLCDRLIENARNFGGVLTINWHDRSLAPERQWGSFYRELLGKLKESGAWFATADQAVSWFRQRRSIDVVRGSSPKSSELRVHSPEFVVPSS